MPGFLHSERVVYILLTATAILWGGNAVTAKYTVGELSPITTAFFRFAWVSIILIGVTLYIEGKKALPTVRQLPWLLALGMTGIFFNNFLFFTGVKYSTAANASLLAAANPVITAVLSALFLHEGLQLRQVIGIALSFVGVGIVVTKGSWQVLSSLSFNYGDLLLAAAPVSWSVYSIIGRKAMREMSALKATAWSSLVGAFALLAMAVREGYHGAIHLSLLGWVNMVYMIIGSGVLAFYWWNQGVAVIGPSRATIFTNLIPLFGMGFAAFFLHERLAWPQLLGAAMILAGVWLTTQAGAIAGRLVEVDNET
ncbi:DMT family transporter [Sporolituus thermophilus]|nr:DMT family transporter [Sporolituus thermophilus]